MTAPVKSPVDYPKCAMCGKPCQPHEDYVVDSQGRTVHKPCYRSALIEGRQSL